MSHSLALWKFWKAYLREKWRPVLITHLWLAPRETVSFVYSSTFNVEHQLRFWGNQTHCFSVEPVISALLFLPTQIEKKKCEKIICLKPAGTKDLPLFQGARPDHVRVESSSRCFLCFRELESFVRPGELVSFNSRHVTDSPPIGNCIWVRRYSKTFWPRNVTKYIIQAYTGNGRICKAPS